MNKMKQKTYKKHLLNMTAIIALSISLTACSSVADRMQNIGKAPALAPIENVKETPDYNFVSMPMPETVQQADSSVKNSLWQASRKGFFKDQRASDIGDILTVIIEIDDTAELTNETTRTRQNTENNNLNTALGFESYLDKILPGAATLPNLVNIDGQTNNVGTGEIEREEKIETRIAAVVADVLPNGNMVIAGKQEVRLNFEVRELKVAGVIRPVDISPGNSINYDQIAEARISYGGRGQISDVQQPRYGQQVLDIIYPF